MVNPIKILIAEPHSIFRQELILALTDEPGITVVAEAADTQEAIRLVRERHPEIAVLDLDLAGSGGLEVVEYIRLHHLPVKVIILTMQQEEQHFNRAIQLNTQGFVRKDSTIEEVIECIRTVAAGGVYISPLLSEHLLHRLQHPVRSISAPGYLSQLTRSERRILRLIAEQKTSREIASELYLSVKTIENHRSNICRKLELEGSNCLLRFALEHREELLNRE